LGEHYTKQTLRNRFVLLGSHGPFAYTVRVKGQKGRKTPISHIELVDDEWRRVAWRGLTAGYARSPYFEAYEATLHTLLMTRQTHLTDFNAASLDFLLAAMEITPKHRYADRYVEINDALIDLRPDFEPSASRLNALPYPQVFEDRFGFTQGLSGLDLVLNTGPEAKTYLP
jgi:hypothetical protein